MVSFLTVVISALKRKKMQNTLGDFRDLRVGVLGLGCQRNQSQHLEVKFDLTPG